MNPSDLRADLRLSSLGEGRYESALSNAWDFIYPSGGVLQSIALAAIQAELADPALRPLSATSTFVSPVPSGPLSLEVEVLRRGRAASQARVRLSPRGGPLGMDLVATFGIARAGPRFVDPTPPEVPPPEACEDLFGGRSPGDRARYFTSFESRIAIGHRWWRERFDPGRAEYARWMRYLVEPEGQGWLALPPIVDMMPPALHERLGPEFRFYAPSLDLTTHFLAPLPAGWFLAHGYVEQAGDGCARGSIAIWGRDGTLAALASQMMILKSVAPGAE